MPKAVIERALVTGGAGFIGIHTVRRLVDQGRRVLVLDDLRHACGEPLPHPAELVRAELSSPEAATAILRFRPQGVIHLAAQGGVSRSVRDPAGDAQVNVVGTAAILRSAVDAGCRRVVFASSGGAIYGRARRLPSREGDTEQPLSPYGAAKLACEGYLGMFRRTFGLSTLALRYSNVYGPHQDGTGEAGVVAISILRLLRGERAQVTGDGLQTRDFVYVGDVARANTAALDAACTGALNVGTGHGTTVLEVVGTLGRLAGHPEGPERTAARPGEVRHTHLLVERVARTLDWRAEVPLEAGLQQTLASFRERAPHLGAAPEPGG
ncbi:MAG TPA: NAD-dependent epimerase/dehydratase family protein [Candidatus Micrarchaeia archaeon]|nr:NAD-dependent epimerase/dehydratase family protein [Candidatus Micrarchaeia archaeon]